MNGAALNITGHATDWMAKAEELNPGVFNFVDGRAAPPSGAGRIDKLAPRDGRLLYSFAAGSMDDVESAVAAARRAFTDGSWSKADPQKRKEILLRFAALIEEHRDELALRESLDVGKPISEATSVDLPATVAIIKYNAEAADKLTSFVYGASERYLAYQLRRPVGVVGGIVGWNFPLALAAQKIGPALAMGNSLVLKPSETSSLSTVRLAELAVEAGVPAGVFNVIHGGGAIGAALARHSDVDMLTFTGSTGTGKRLLVALGESSIKRVLLECGGKAPNIVFEDCPDLGAVADSAVARAFWNQGQVCTASSRLLVQDSIKDALLARVAERVSQFCPGDPLKPETRLGALVNEEHRRKVLGYIDRGMAEGATEFCRGGEGDPVEGGCFISPRVFDNVLHHHAIAQEEIFGPVLSVLSFKDEAEAINIANGTVYGLSAILWSNDLVRVNRVVRALNVGSVTVYGTASPSGGLGIGAVPSGGHKQSGFGVEGGLEGLMEYTVSTAVQQFA